MRRFATTPPCPVCCSVCAPPHLAHRSASVVMSRLRRRSSSGYRGVRARPNRKFYAEICSGEEGIGLDTFKTAHEAARVRRGRLAPRPFSPVGELLGRLNVAAGRRPRAVAACRHAGGEAAVA
ncbi:hypothetical protein QYE76_028911 [Lolium multiflorum]|uniref:Uncharacterized protein n=1 Tax=Lolium multiflorum TaxID=4521 RepID=A0AAD8VHS4_LOLMU|nr:hypothetical protein QYE76_028911 [Lolium multiflorum]